jgi:hypothetical protein
MSVKNRKPAAVWKDWKMLEEAGVIPDPSEEHYKYGPLGEERNKQMLYELLKQFSHHELKTVCFCRTQGRKLGDIQDAILRGRVELFYDHFCELFMHFVQERSLRVRILKHKIPPVPPVPPDTFLDAIDQENVESES